MITLYKHQKRFIETAPDKYGIFHACGTGKTMTGLYTGVQKADSILIICPKGVFSKWMIECRDRMKNQIPWKVITQDRFRIDWESVPPFDCIIIDEAHHFSSIRSKRHKNLLKYIKKNKPRYIYTMTATPYRREPMNIYALGKILGRNWNYFEFRQKFYTPIYVPNEVWIPKEGIEQEVAKLVRSIGDVVAFSECGDLPPIKHKIEYFDLTASQKRAFEELELIEANPLTYYLRQHQLCSGIGAETAKLDRLDEIAECNAKIAIFCRYTGQIDAVEAYMKKLGYVTYRIDGSTADKSAVAQNIESAAKAVVIIQSECAEGFELPSVDVVVFASMGYSYLAYEQSIGRFIRINKKSNPKLFIYMLTARTIDEDIYKNIMKKQDFSLEIYAKKRS